MRWRHEYDHNSKAQRQDQGKSGNIRAIMIMLGQFRIENTVRYLDVDIEDALILAEKTEI